MTLGEKQKINMHPLGQGIALAGIWICVALVSNGDINTFNQLSEFGFLASIAVILFV